MQVEPTKGEEDQLALARERLALERESLALERERLEREQHRLEALQADENPGGRGASSVSVGFWVLFSVFVLVLGLMIGWGIGYDVGREHSPKPRPVLIGRTLAEGLTRIWEAPEAVDVVEEASPVFWAQPWAERPVWDREQRLWFPEDTVLIR